jgi:hypothetical protein
MDIIDEYNSGRLSGWAEAIAEPEYQTLKDDFLPEDIVLDSLGTDLPEEFYQFELARKYLGSDLPPFVQKTGSCTSFALKYAASFLMFAEIVLGGDDEVYTETF